MGKEDDIAAALPRPPLPAPARREAAIAEALRRFDGGVAPAPAATAGDRSGPRPAPWWAGQGRPWAGALASALLVALIAVPLALKSIDQPSTDGVRGQRPGATE